jgi:hypothetical protein
VKVISAIAAAVLLMGGSMKVSAQSPHQSSSLQAGLYGGGILATPSASFSQFPGVINCIDNTVEDAFTSGSGGGFSVAGVFGIKPSFGEGFAGHLGGAVKVGLASSTTTFEARQTLGSASDPSGNLQPVVTGYTIEAKVTEVRIEPVATLWLSQKTPLMVSLGARVGVLMGGTFNHVEKLVTPAGGTFGDGSAERNRMEGDLQDKNALQAGLVLGLGYDFALSPIFSIRPELSGTLGLTSPVNGVDWKGHEVRFGVSVLYTLPKEGPSPLQGE